MHTFHPRHFNFDTHFLLANIFMIIVFNLKNKVIIIFKFLKEGSKKMSTFSIREKQIGNSLCFHTYNN